MANKSLDIIVLGATGFTGKCTVKHLARLTKEKYWDVTWGISGRSQDKLQSLIKELNATGLGTKNMSIVESNIENGESLKKVLQMVKIVINCTGPNSILSPPIVKACIECGTHYVDISAEIFHILNVYRIFHKAAVDASVLVVPSCGYAAIPNETAMIYLDRQFKGTLNTVECYTELLIPKRACIPGRTVLHNGTWTSLVYEMETYKERLGLWKELFPNPIEPEPEEMKRSFFHRHNRQTWFPFPGVEKELVDMSQRYLYEKSQKKPAHFKAYTTVPMFFHFIVVPIMFLYYYLSYFKCFRKLLINFPCLVTWGYVSQRGPSEKIRQDTKYNFVLNGKGWDLEADLNSKPTKTMSVKVSGSDPGYDTTAVAIIMSAITILKESSNMPKSFFHRHNRQTWFPFPGVEKELVDMSQRYLYEKSQKKPAHFKAYTTVPMFFHFIVVPIMFLYYYLSYFKCFRKLLINFPCLVTWGYVSQRGPSEKIRQDTKYNFVLNGKGWDLEADLNSKPTKTMSVKVSGSDPGYDTTAVAIIMSAITILKESSNMPKGGVIMPGAAFFRTDIVDRLMHEGLTFEVVGNKVV